MSNRNNQILIGSILLDLNRWGDPKTPTYEVSDWTDRFREAGFDGMELWEYHATLCSDAEREKLLSSNFPATIYNTYCDFDDQLCRCATKRGRNDRPIRLSRCEI